MGKRGEEFIIILDVNAVFSSEELVSAIESTARAAAPAVAVS
jgi:hypothetical protein